MILAPWAQGQPRAAPAQDQRLKQLWAAFALRFLAPAPHMALAKHFHDQGNRLQAFYLLEAARRGRFEEAEFDHAFALAFRGEVPPDYSQMSEATLLLEHERNPNAPEPLVMLGNYYIARKDWPKAREYLARVQQLEPAEFTHVQALMGVLQRESQPEEARRLLREYAAKYPQTNDGFRVRVAEAMETDLAQAKLLLAEAIMKFPQDGSFSFNLGTILQREGAVATAENHLVRAAKLAPDSVYIQAWVGRFFLKVKQDEHRALAYYLTAYFLDPHAYETEYVESRIARINDNLAQIEYDRLVKRRVPLRQILAEPNPVVVHKALAQMAKAWRPAHQKLLIDLLGHDDLGVRWSAMMFLKEKTDQSFDATLKALLTDQDPRKRGLAAYLAVHRWQQASFDLIRRMLREDTQLVRFDAVSALAMESGPAGREVLREHLANETNETLRKLIEQALKPE